MLCLPYLACTCIDVYVCVCLLSASGGVPSVGLISSSHCRHWRAVRSSGTQLRDTCCCLLLSSAGDSLSDSCGSSLRLLGSRQGRSEGVTHSNLLPLTLIMIAQYDRPSPHRQTKCCCTLGFSTTPRREPSGPQDETRNMLLEDRAEVLDR
jgi:hypothetical protein